MDVADVESGGWSVVRHQLGVQSLHEAIKEPRSLIMHVHILLACHLKGNLLLLVIVLCKSPAVLGETCCLCKEDDWCDPVRSLGNCFVYSVTDSTLLLPPTFPR